MVNPTTQGERHGPDAESIHEYVPSLRGVDPETIHSWDESEPIADHAERREAAIETFERTRRGLNRPEPVENGRQQRIFPMTCH